MKLDPVRVRRALVARWGLDRRCASVEEVGRRLVAFHATDPATLVLAAWSRLTPRSVPEVVTELQRALEVDRSLVRQLGMRRTLHVVPVADLPWVLAVYTAKLGPMTRKTVEQVLVLSGVATDGSVREAYDGIRERTLAVLADRDATVTQLYDHVPELTARFEGAPGKSYAGSITVGGRFVDSLGAAGHIVRARAQGGWKVNTCSWTALDRWLPELPERPASGEAHQQLVRRYLEAFGPATLDDLAWWAGLNKGPVKTAVGALGADLVEVVVPGWSGPRWALASQLDDLQVAREPAGVAFLPALDPSVMGYADRDWFLPPDHKGPLYDRSGNTAPTVWSDGVVVGAWAQPKGGEVRYKLFADADGVAEVAADLQGALGGERVAPRFPTPVVKELAG